MKQHHTIEAQLTWRSPSPQCECSSHIRQQFKSQIGTSYGRDSCTSITFPPCPENLASQIYSVSPSLLQLRAQDAVENTQTCQTISARCAALTLQYLDKKHSYHSYIRFFVGPSLTGGERRREVASTVRQFSKLPSNPPRVFGVWSAGNVQTKASQRWHGTFSILYRQLGSIWDV